MPLFLRPCLTLAFLSLFAATAVAAQATTTNPRRWRGSAQLNGSASYGEAEQQLIGSRFGLSRADSIVELSGDLQMLYGEAKLQDEPRAVTQRLWLASMSLDLWPVATWSPFGFGSFESNFAKRIRSRYSSGLGAKVTLLRSKTDEASLSLSLLDERTIPTDGIATRLTRWSARARARKAVSDRLRISHTTFWKPAASMIREYVVTSSSALEFSATDHVALSLTLQNNYDSDALRRGARAYHDGQVLAGLTAKW